MKPINAALLHPADLHSMLVAGRCAAFEWDEATGLLIHSEGLEALLGFAEGQVLPANVRQLVHPADLLSLEMVVSEARASLEKSWQADVRLKHVHHGYRWFVAQGMLNAAQDQRTSRVAGVLIDLHDRREAEILLRMNEERWKLALESSGDGLWDWYALANKQYLSQTLLDMYGYTQEEIDQHDHTLTELTHPDDLPGLREAEHQVFDEGLNVFTFERRIRCKNGQWKWVQTRGSVIERDYKGQPLRMIGTHTDITERKGMEEQVRQQALYDALTGLPNRRLLRDRLEQEIARSGRERRHFAVLFLDLDRFKEVNDTLGHDVGDSLLVQTAQRLRACVRETDTIARMGGDEFTVLVTQLQHPEELTVLLNKMLHQLEQVYRLGMEEVYVSGSIGVAVYPDDGDSVDTLYKHADEALYAAKSMGRNQYCYFTADMHQRATHRSRLSHDLRSALANQQLHVVFQPIVDLRSGHVRKAETLLRWQHPQLGFVSPAEFIPLAESTGRIVEIGDWVFEQAVRQVWRWREVLNPQFQLSLNCSPVQFYARNGTTMHWIDRLEQFKLPGQALAIEITEGVLLDNHEGIHQQLLNWCDAGLQVALDDFGTGYSSLSYLQRFDIDYIKIDQSFVRNLQPDSTQLVLCTAMINMAHSLGLRVIAEGVETEMQCALLRAADCDYAQGYYLARPMDAQMFERWMTAIDGVVDLPDKVSGTETDWVPL